MNEFSIKIDADTSEAEKKIDALIEKADKAAEYVTGKLHGHKFRVLSTEAIYCECGDIRRVPAAVPSYPPYIPTPINPWISPITSHGNGTIRVSYEAPTDIRLGEPI